MPVIEKFLPAEPVTPGPGHWWFGYYDKFPWDVTGRYMLAMRSEFMDRPPRSGDRAEIGTIDLNSGCAWRKLDETGAWNWQQGSMLQWLPDAPDRLILYNILDGDRYACAIRDVRNGEVRVLPRPVYAVSPDGKLGITLDFARLHRHRPGYGYYVLPDSTLGDPAPANVGIWLVDLRTGESRLIVSIRQLAGFEPDETMTGASHWVNHLQFNADGSRFVFLHRWRNLEKKQHRTRMFTANPDGSELYCLNGPPMTSHFDWRDREYILAWAERPGVGKRYFLFRDRSRDAEIVGDGLFPTDGHCSWSPDRQWILTDTYPDVKDNKRTLILYHLASNTRFDVGRFYSPPELADEIRCDLHPRWSRDGRKVCFDSAHEGTRRMYVMDVSEIIEGTR
ncbi:MAG: hypothetical protein N3A38_07780 [Planctomycetota bacterium]|nr:hypothetical protein [Planctomycetota bacterium]